MPKELQPIDISHMPELVRLVQEMLTAQEPRLLQWKGEDWAILKPLRPRRRASSRGKVLKKSDPLFRIIGLGRSGLTDVSENKHKYLTEAYMPKGL